MESEFLLHVAGLMICGIFTAGAVYAGIRADIKYMRSTLQEVKDGVMRAHRRLDDHIEGHK